MIGRSASPGCRESIDGFFHFLEDFVDQLLLTCRLTCWLACVRGRGAHPRVAAHRPTTSRPTADVTQNAALDVAWAGVPGLVWVYRRPPVVVLDPENDRRDPDRDGLRR
ncbi:hypothetical protein GCM10023160_12590 [Brachybacterium paraconglomeratum]